MKAFILNYYDFNNQNYDLKLPTYTIEVQM